MARRTFEIVVIGGGHAGAEAAWAAANLGASVALVTMDPSKTGAMSCNPAIGGLAKGQMVREIDALGGLMALAADATGIQFRVLNASKGAAVQGPRCQSDKYAYAREVQRLLSTRRNLEIIAGTVDELTVVEGVCRGVTVRRLAGGDGVGELLLLEAGAVVLTTGTFMRGLMHTGEQKSEGGRVGERAAVGISGALAGLGFELGRLKTGTPPRLAAESIDFEALEVQPGDDEPIPFSDLSPAKLPGGRFPAMSQRPCHITWTSEASHELIRANLHRAPMYNGQIQTSGPRYCPSIEDKVVRFADRSSHHVFLEPESLETNEIYCNGISTSLPAEVQIQIVRALPGCHEAAILRPGYAVEYDMVWPHQIDATCMTKRIPGLLLAGQINGTSGYEEAAGQGLLAGLNAVRYVRGQEAVRLGRDQAFLGVMLDDLVTKTPREPYRMFTSRAEYRLLLRADNADARLTPLGRELGLVDDVRWEAYAERQAAAAALRAWLDGQKRDGVRMADWVRRPHVDADVLLGAMRQAGLPPAVCSRRLVASVLAELQYAGYIERQRRDVQRLAAQEQVTLPQSFDFDRVTGLRTEARHVLKKFRPATLGQASRLAGINPADLMVLSVAMGR